MPTPTLNTSNNASVKHKYSTTKLKRTPHAQDAPKGLSTNIPVNGPVLIMRGAVYLDDKGGTVAGAAATNSNQYHYQPSSVGAGGGTSASYMMTMGSSSASPAKAVSFADLGGGYSHPPPKNPNNGTGLPRVAPKTSIYNAMGDDKPRQINVQQPSSSFAAAMCPSSYRSTSPVALSPISPISHGAIVVGGGGATTMSSLINSRQNQPSTSAAAANPNIHLKPLMAHQATPLDAVVKSAETYVDSELRLLAASVERDSVAYRAAASQAFCQGVRMVLPALANQKVSNLIERCLKECEGAIVVASHVSSQPTRSAEERTIMEEELRSMYMAAAEERSRELDRRQAEMENSSANTAQRVLQLENLLATARQEILKLKNTQNDESDRFSSMAQSVLESRIAAQKAEILLHEMRERYDRVKVTEMVYMDLLKDHQDMNLLLREQRIPFKTRIHFSVDDLLGEPSAAILAAHANTIKERQQQEAGGGGGTNNNVGMMTSAASASIGNFTSMSAGGGGGTNTSTANAGQ